MNSIGIKKSKDSWSVINEDSKGRNAITPSPRAIGEHIKFNKTTEAQSLQRKATPFFMRKRGENS
ncbi:MAG: hypothetical protein J6S93_01525, partial [Paludibacteraceae bacterium]|nr:hypothetical protein [Paludibacteraceae bacterium]